MCTARILGCRSACILKGRTSTEVLRGEPGRSFKAMTCRCRLSSGAFVSVLSMYVPTTGLAAEVQYLERTHSELADRGWGPVFAGPDVGWRFCELLWSRSGVVVLG